MSFVAALAACAAITLMTPVAQADPVTELMGDGPTPIPLKNASMITKTAVGYRYQAGQQNSHLTVTLVGGKLLFADTGTQELRRIPKSCTRQSVARGVAALCRITARFDGKKLFLEIWPRLGNDFVDGSTLSSRFRLWVLADEGDDTILGGLGDDFINGAQDDDAAWGGAGNDWIRTGIGNDELWGGSGDDKLVGVDGRDVIHGEEGDDRVAGGPGHDVLWADAGTDLVTCGAGPDNAYIDELDRALQCESLSGY
jgi:hypothetical protein